MIKIKSYAKLNLTLEILNKNLNNMHDIYGIFQNINLFDEISVNESSVDEVITNNNTIHQKHNIVYKVLKLLKNELNINYSFEIKIKKNIPLSSGLGGGSSNAAAIIYGLNKMLNLKLSTSDMITLSKNIGSDIPFFFLGGTCLVSGQGENIKKLNNIIVDKFNLFSMPIILKNKTKTMYSFINKNNFSSMEKTDNLKKIILASNKVLPENLYNVFFDIAKDKYQEVNEFSKMMKDDFNNCSLSGAGMTLFAISNNNFNPKIYNQFKSVEKGIEIVS